MENYYVAKFTEKEIKDIIGVLDYFIETEELKIGTYIEPIRKEIIKQIIESKELIKLFCKILDMKNNEA